MQPCVMTMLRVTTRDVGVTEAATIWIGEQKVIEFYTRTRHADRSIDIAEQLLAKVLRGLLAGELNNQGMNQYFGDD